MKMLQCPYEILHIVRENRFEEHVKKCKEQHPELDYKFCTIDESHLIHKDDYEDHVKTCAAVSSSSSIILNQDITITNESENVSNDSSKDAGSYTIQDPGQSMSNSRTHDADFIAMAFDGIDCIDVNEFSLGFEIYSEENNVIYSKGRGRSNLESSRIKNIFSQLRRPIEAIPPGFGCPT